MNAPDPALIPKRCACDHGEQPCDSCLRDSDARLRALRERMGPEVHTAPEVTAAVRRATIAAAHRAGVGFAALDAPTQALHLDVTRTGLAAALDVEEMARVLAEHQRSGVIEEGPNGWGYPCTCGTHLPGDPDTPSSVEMHAHQAAMLAEAGLLRDDATIDALNERCRILVDQTDRDRADLDAADTIRARLEGDVERRNASVAALLRRIRRVRYLAERWIGSPSAALQQSGREVLEALDGKNENEEA